MFKKTSHTEVENDTFYAISISQMALNPWFQGITSLNLCRLAGRRHSIIGRGRVWWKLDK